MGRRFRDKRLFEREDSRFIWARVRGEDGKIQRIPTRCTDEKAATLFADEYERTAADPAYRRAAEATLGDAIAEHVDQLFRRKVSAARQGICATKIGHFVRLWGTRLPLARITNDLVLHYIDTREADGVKPLTIKMELGVLGNVLEWARFRGTFPRDLAEVIPPYSGKHRPKTRAPTQAEVTALIQQLDERRGAHVAFIAGTGARLGESFRAERQDVDIDGLTVLIRGTKTERARDLVPITGLTMPLIVYAIQHAPGKGVLFDPWGKLWRDIQAACVRADIEPLSPNDLRRAYGTWHRLAGATAEQVSLLLRHTTDTLAQTTYARVSAASLGEPLRRLIPVEINTVSISDAEAAETAQTDTNKPMRSAENTAPPAGVGPATFALGKLTPSSAFDRRKIGGKLAWSRRLSERNVPVSDATDDLRVSACRCGEHPCRCDAAPAVLTFRARARHWFMREVA